MPHYEKEVTDTYLSIEQKIGQLFFVGIKGTELDQKTAKLLTDIEPGGVCLFARNIKEAQQTRDLLDAIRSVSNLEPFLSLDQEGGLVDRLRRIVEPMPAACEFTRAEDVRRFGCIVAETISILGFNFDFAPVIDVVDGSRSDLNNGLRSRAFGRSSFEVIELGGAFATEIKAFGIFSSLKHFPGLGAARVDSHEELPAIHIGIEELSNIDLHPYRHFISTDKVDSIMVAHAAFPNTGLSSKDSIGRDLPASLDPNFVTSLLRDQLGFGGVVITDDLEMGAIVKNYGIGEACTMAIEAGADMLAICADETKIREGHSAVIEAVRSGRVSEAAIDRALARILDLKGRIVQPLPFNLSRLDELSMEIKDLKDSLKLSPEEIIV